VSLYLPESLRAQLDEADRRRCAYCLTSEANSGLPMTHDHIQPLSKGGETTFGNLCLACRLCNEFKADLTRADDPLTGELTPLFNPRAQQWAEHFAWSTDGTHLVGLTPTGRATIIALRMNNPTILAARRRWAMGGWHPPAD